MHAARGERRGVEGARARGECAQRGIGGWRVWWGRTSESHSKSALSQRASKSLNAPPAPAASSKAARLSGVPRMSNAATTSWL